MKSIHHISSFTLTRSWPRWTLHALVFPSVPGLLHVDLYKYDREKKIASISAFRDEIRGFGHIQEKTIVSEHKMVEKLKAEATLIECRENKYLTENLIAQFKMTENILEDFVQLSLLVIMMLTFESETGTMSHVERKILLNSVSLDTFVVSAIVSLFSLIRGHMNLLFTIKKGMKTFKGSVITFTYFMVGISAR